MQSQFGRTPGRPRTAEAVPRYLTYIVVTPTLSTLRQIPKAISVKKRFAKSSLSEVRFSEVTVVFLT